MESINDWNFVFRIIKLFQRLYPEEIPKIAVRMRISPTNLLHLESSNFVHEIGIVIRQILKSAAPHVQCSQNRLGQPPE